MQPVQPLDPAYRVYESLLPEFDHIVSKNSKDKKWFVLNQEGRLALEARPESIFALLIEAVSRIWDYVVSFFVTVKHPLQDKFVSIADNVERYLESETIEMRRSDFLNGYSQCINEIFRSAARMSRVGLLSDAPMRTGHPLVEKHILTSQNAEGAYKTKKYIHFKNALPDAHVELKMRGDGWEKTFSLMKPNSVIDYELLQEGFITPKVTAKILQRIEIRDLSKDYSLRFDEGGKPVFTTSAKQMHSAACQVSCSNDKSLPMELVLSLAGKVKERVTLLPDQRWQYLVDKAKAPAVQIDLSYQTPPKSLWLGCKEAVYTCTVSRVHIGMEAHVSER